MRCIRSSVERINCQNTREIWEGASISCRTTGSPVRAEKGWGSDIQRERRRWGENPPDDHIFGLVSSDAGRQQGWWAGAQTTMCLGSDNNVLPAQGDTAR